MYPITYVLLTYTLAQVAGAFKLPFHIPWVTASLGEHEQTPLSVLLHSEPPSNRIAVIGAGAGGSAAAFWISKARESYGLDVEIDVFDSNSYIGGRSITVQPYDDPELEPIELGASIFVKDNRNLWRATDEFGLERKDFEDGDETMGIWDGEQFLLTTSGGKGWWDTLKVLWRYGYKAPTRTKALVKTMLGQFVSLYTPRWGKTPFANLTGLATELGWTDIINQTTTEYLDAQGIDHRWTVEMVESATRVNYGQNGDELHALEGMVSLAASGASSIKGGNWQLFDQFVKRSNATVYLNTTVTSISQDSAGKFTLRTHTAGSSTSTDRHYRAVILAAPFHSSSIDLSLQSSLGAGSAIPAQPYVHLHVTLLSTSSPHARPRYFKLKENAAPPNFVLTTWEGVRARNGTHAPEFNSLSYHGKIVKRDGSPANTSAEGGEEWAVKIFSKEKIEDRWLKRVFGTVGWVYRKEWDAYPVLPPTTTFPPLKLAKGLYYVNAFEPFISTMETETIAARNVVELLMQEEYDAGICKCPGDTDDEDSWVYGWDCNVLPEVPDELA